ncbi:MAG: hypothetical protein HYR76_10990 [Ignavibacteria bacterium]|nr:hypothetical protein [Ignavibacteria bacterium]
MLIFSVLIIQLPLLNYLGFEFSVAVALIVPWVMGILTINSFRSRFPITVPVMKEFLDAFLASIIRGITLLLIPFVVATLNVFFVKNCSYVEGVGFYLIIPVVTAAWSTALASFCFVMFRRAFLAYVLILILVLLHPFYVGYVSPQIYSYNFIFGYFPGFSYDEVLSITPTLILFRFLTMMTGVMMFLVSLLATQHELINQSLAKKLLSVGMLFRRDRLNVAILFLGALMVGAFVFRVPLGFESSSAQVKQSLSSHYATDHFDIYYAPISFSDEEIQWVAATHEFRFEQVTSALQTAFPGKISSYIYPDDDMKKKFIGTSTTNIAKPWRREIHLDKDSWQGTLKHELVHVIAGEFGMPIIKAHYHIGLVEGLAMTVEGEFGNRTVNQYAAAVKAFNLIKNPEQLIKPLGFATRASSLSYVLMGSFCRYIIDRYGIVRFKELYSGRSEMLVYGKPYDELVAEWQTFLERVKVPKESRRHVEFYFKRPSIFAKECARKVAALNAEGYDILSKKKAEEAKRSFSAALTTSWNTESYAGLVRSAFDAGRYDSVVQLIDARSRDSIGRSSFINLYLLYGDALWENGDVGASRKAYEEVFSLDLSERFNEAAALRLTVIDDTALRPKLITYFVGSISDSAAISFLNDLALQSKNSIIPYFKAKLFFRQKNYQNVITALDTISSAFRMPILNATKEQMQAQAFFMLKQYEQARAHFWQSLNYLTNEASIAKVNDWLERCEWFASKAKFKMQY